ncbi:hypothetical protein OAI46_07510 [Alphaproteobacteria bacterium]|nr:hypothetical protein [Alphaproteobacteria bacterium]MDC0148688.1 hypothetical protein [Alphaproteobacteria bacterium]
MRFALTLMLSVLCVNAAYASTQHDFGRVATICSSHGIQTIYLAPETGDDTQKQDCAQHCFLSMQNMDMSGSLALSPKRSLIMVAWAAHTHPLATLASPYKAGARAPPKMFLI